MLSQHPARVDARIPPRGRPTLYSELPSNKQIGLADVSISRVFMASAAPRYTEQMAPITSLQGSHGKLRSRCEMTNVDFSRIVKDERLFVDASVAFAINEREGWQVNHKRVYRLYVEEKLSCGANVGDSVAACASQACGVVCPHPEVNCRDTPVLGEDGAFGDTGLRDDYSGFALLPGCAKNPCRTLSALK